MLKKFHWIAAGTLALATVGVVEAGVGFDYHGNGGTGSGNPYNFAVSTTSGGGGVGQLTSGTLSGGAHGSPEGNDRRKLDIISLFQRSRTGFGGGFGGGGGFARTRNSSGVSGGTGSYGGGGGGGFTGGGDDQTNGSVPVNAGYCYCVCKKPGGGGHGGPGNGGPGNGGPGNGGPGNGGGGPNPSVVPEPSSLALWTLVGTALVAVTRRRSGENQ